MKRSVRIVGAGPAGLAAAIAVERCGAHAVVSERHGAVGHRFHDDFQGLENWTTRANVLEELRGMGIAPEFDHVPFHQFVVYDPDGRAYLLVSGGRGTVASCMFSDFHRERRYVERTVEFFGKAAGLEMRNPRRFGGFGNVAASPNVSKGSLLYAGEAAGLQDALFGFGMRYALVSGHLAGRIAAAGGDGREYRRLGEQRLGKILRRGLVNRYFYGRLGNHGYSALLRWIERRRDVRPWLHPQFQPGSPRSASRAPRAPSVSAWSGSRFRLSRRLRLHVVSVPARNRRPR